MDQTNQLDSAGWTRRFMLGMTMLAFSALALAQTQTPTPEQMEVFQSLPREQQQQILEQFRDRGDQALPAPAAAAAISQPKPEMDEDTAQALLETLEKEVRLRADDSLILTIEVLGDPDRTRNEFVRDVRNGNPYQLDRTGRLVMPDASAIVLAGLTAGEAASRLNSEPRLRGFRFDVKLLPVEPELKPYGYDLFRRVPTTFAPATDIPVPAEYVLGPGDTLELQLIGERGGRHTLTVGRDGTVSFPEIGPVAVASLKFAEAKEMLEQRVAEQMIGLRASVSMGALRSIQVFVLGEAERPGSYTVSGLSTITNALFTSGGVRPIGSLRNIQLKRNGQLVRRLDLYDLLLNGDTSNDERLLPGDVIFIPPVGTTVAMTGEIRRPAIYEVKEGAVAAEILNLSGGLTPEADPRTGRLERIDDRRNRTVLNLDLTTAEGRGTRLQTGDTVHIGPIRDSLEAAVSLDGHVHRAARTQFRPGMRLTDLIGSLDELKPLADLRYVLIRRETGPDRRVSVVSTDLAAAFAEPASPANIALQARDQVHVFDLATSRERVLDPIFQDLGRQSSRDEPRQIVSIDGSVKVPGQYPLESGMTLTDLLRAGGGLNESAYRGIAELARYEVISGEQRQTEVVEVSLAEALDGSAVADLALRPFDHLVVKEVPLWRETESITIEGEVRFPGSYAIRRGESLKSVLERAGGLTDMAFAKGSVFTRQDLKARERRQLKLLAERFEREIASLALQEAQSAEGGKTTQTLAAGQSLLADLQAAEPVGRLVINLDAVLSAPADSQAGLLVKDGDRLLVPRVAQEVTVMGEVQNATSHLYQAGLSRDDYLLRSGGPMQRADRKRIYVIRADGGVAAGSSSSWFTRGGTSDIQPGDTIVVPLDAERMKPLTLWTSVTQILFNVAVAVAAVNSF